MELLYQYERYLSNYSQKTQKVYLYNVKLYLEYLGTTNPIQILNISKGEIYNYLAYMDHLSKNTRKIRIYSIKNFYSFLNQKISDFLFEDIKLYGLNKKMPNCLTWTQSKELINYYPDKRNKLIIYLLLTTGIRLSECANIKTKDIDLKEQTIRIKCKGNITRNIFINKKCSNMIQEYMHGEKLFNITNHDIQYIVKKALKQLGFKGSTHTLRHTAASLMYQNTRDVLLVKEFLGHKSIESTQIYMHLNNEQIKNAVNSNPLARWGI